MHLLTLLALKGRSLTLIATLSVVVIGAWTLTRLQVELFPDVDFPLITLSTAHPGVTAETILEEITIPLEGAFENVRGLETVRSISSNGISLVTAEFEFGSDMNLAVEDVSEHLANISLPDGVQLPRAARLSPSDIPIFQFSVLRKAGSGEIGEIIRLINSEILPELQGVPGVFSADIPMGAKAGVTITRTNGWPSLPVTVVKEPEANTITVVEGITKEMGELTSRLPPDIDMIIVVNQAPPIQASIDSLKRESALGALIAVAVIFAFLLSVRPTIVSSISIPVSILGALIVMGWQGMTLNMMTLGGLAIAVGRVVDDSIVVLENVYRHIQEGGNKIVATIEATREVAGAITTSTLTTIAVFLPLAFIGGIIGTFFVPFALTVTYALLVSLIVALTVVPVLGSLVIRQSDLKGGNDTWLQATYTGVIHWALSHKLAILGFAFALFVGSLVLLRFIPQSFFPTVGDDLVTAEMRLASETSPDRMLNEVIQVEGVLGELRNSGIVENFQVTMGRGGFSGPGAGGPNSPNAANLSIRLSEGQEIDETAELLRNMLAGAAYTIAINQAQGGPGNSNMLELVLIGNNYDEVSSTAQKIISALQDVEGLEKIGDAENSLNGSAQISRFNGMRSLTISG